ncbi:hypothetical protein [Microbulbifer magnicolonia]|uniref:hypothetical protein n=1 Tax=Microbulbifer magnicolonia TaxID=3109744 RepID=UPI002B415099|nr:hypothetical protein [Microbulbifer sp. GG15]
MTSRDAGETAGEAKAGNSEKYPGIGHLRIIYCRRATLLRVFTRSLPIAGIIRYARSERAGHGQIQRISDISTASNNK